MGTFPEEKKILSRNLHPVLIVAHIVHNTQIIVAEYDISEVKRSEHVVETTEEHSKVHIACKVGQKRKRESSSSPKNQVKQIFSLWSHDHVITFLMYVWRHKRNGYISWTLRYIHPSNFPSAKLTSLRTWRVQTKLVHLGSYTQLTLVIEILPRHVSLRQKFHLSLQKRAHRPNENQNRHGSYDVQAARYKLWVSKDANVPADNNPKRQILRTTAQLARWTPAHWHLPLVCTIL